MTNKELYAKLNDAPDLHKVLVEHFTYLADSDGFMPVLETVMAKAKSVKLEENNLIICFPDDNEMSCSEPAADGYEKWTASFRNIVSKHEFISFPDDSGWALELGESGNFEPEMFEESDSDLTQKVDNLDDILCPFTDYSDWWIYHPTKKNPQGEPMLCMASHESADIEERVTCNVGSLFLKRMAECLDLDDVVPDVEVEITTEDDEEWVDEDSQDSFDVTDSDVFETLYKPTEATDIPAFIAGLEALLATGSFSPQAYDSLLSYTNNIIAKCDNKGIDAFPAFEAFFRLFPNAKGKSFQDQLDCVGSFIAAIKNHLEYYPQIKTRFMDGPLDKDTVVCTLYYLALRLANMGLVDEARVELKRLEEIDVYPLIGQPTEDFEEPLKSEFAELKDNMYTRWEEKGKK